MTFSWGCIWLRNYLGLAGEHGLSVVARRDGEIRTFYLEARSLNEGQVATLTEATQTEVGAVLQQLQRDEAGRPVPFYLTMRVSLAYCPHCGADLRALIAQHRADFDALTELHRAFD